MDANNGTKKQEGINRPKFTIRTKPEDERKKFLLKFEEATKGFKNLISKENKPKIDVQDDK